MSFQAYLDNIEKKTGKTATDFKKMATMKGFLEKGQLKSSVKAGDIVKWLKDDFSLGHGHAMAIYAVLKGRSDELKSKSVVKPGKK
jgi:hypothetical protein